MKKYIEFGNRLKQLRAHRSQADFAKKLRLPFRTYQDYEAGVRMPKGDVLYRIASICEMPVEWLMTGEIEKREMTVEDIRQCLHKEGYSKEEIDAFLKYREGKPLQVCEEPAIHNKERGDPEMAEIIQILKEYPQDMKLVLKLLKGKKDIKEALEGFEISKIKEQEG